MYIFKKFMYFYLFFSGESLLSIVTTYKCFFTKQKICEYKSKKVIQDTSSGNEVSWQDFAWNQPHVISMFYLFFLKISITYVRPTLIS